MPSRFADARGFVPPRSEPPVIPAGSEEYALELAANPAFFGESVLGRDYWKVPRLVMASLTRPRARVAWKSCHSVGKTQTAADLTLWNTATGNITLTTAPTLRQVKRLVWNKVRSAHKKALLPLGIEPLTHEWQISPDVFALGLTAESASAMQGFHGSILVIVDEAMGVPAEMYTAIESMRSGDDVRVLQIGNPTERGGPFYETFENRAADYLFSTSAFETPNFEHLFEHPDQPWEEVADILEEMHPDDPRLFEGPRPYLISPAWVKERLEEWGRDNPWFHSRVLGEFPEQSESSLVTEAWAKAAARNLAPPDDARLQAGIDVAGDDEGNDGSAETVVYLRRGTQIIAPPFATKKADHQGEVLAWLKAREIELLGEPRRGRSKILVAYDSIGVGAYFAKPLRAAGFRCVGVNVGRPANDSDRFRNLRAELFWGLRDRFREGGIGGLCDKLTVAQITAIRWSTNTRGQIIIESKADMLERGIKSPDRADALMLCFADERRIKAIRNLSDTIRVF